MNRNKLNLSELKVESFVTSLKESKDKLRGGSLPFSLVEDQCNNSVVDDSTTNGTNTEEEKGCYGATRRVDLCQFTF